MTKKYTAITTGKCKLRETARPGWGFFVDKDGSPINHAPMVVSVLFWLDVLWGVDPAPCMQPPALARPSNLGQFFLFGTAEQIINQDLHACKILTADTAECICPFHGGFCRPVMYVLQRTYLFGGKRGRYNWPLRRQEGYMLNLRHPLIMVKRASFTGFERTKGT